MMHLSLSSMLWMIDIVIDGALNKSGPISYDISPWISSSIGLPLHEHYSQPKTQPLLVRINLLLPAGRLNMNPWGATNTD